VAFLLILTSLSVQLFGEDSVRDKNLTVAEWKGVTDKLFTIENELESASKALKQKTIIDGDQILIAKIDSRMEKVESLFLSKAEIAVTIPLLKREIESIKKEVHYQKENISSTNNMVIVLMGVIFAQLAAVFFYVRERQL
jgi:hypothetical protein